MPDRNQVIIEIYDLRGMLIERRKLGEMNEGENSVPLFSEPAAQRRACTCTGCGCWIRSREASGPP